MVYFEITSETGKRIRTTKGYWEMITKQKHPIIEELETEVKETIKSPNEVRQSRKDNSIHLYYKRYPTLKNRFICVLIKCLNKNGFVVSAYLADNVKKGEVVWRKKKLR